MNGQSAQQRIIVGQFPDYYFDICLCTADTSTLCVHVAYCIYCYVYMYIWCVHVHMVCTCTYGVYIYIWCVHVHCLCFPFFFVCQIYTYSRKPDSTPNVRLIYADNIMDPGHNLMLCLSYLLSIVSIFIIDLKIRL